MKFGWKDSMKGSEFDRRRLARRERISDEIVDDPYEGTSSTSARDLEVLFEQVLALNKIYGKRFDHAMPHEEVWNLQSLEDYIGACYNNYNANVEINKDEHGN